MATLSSVLAWRIPGTVEPDGLPSMGSHRVRHDWSNLAAAAAKVTELAGTQIQAEQAYLIPLPWESHPCPSLGALFLLWGLWHLSLPGHWLIQVAGRDTQLSSQPRAPMPWDSLDLPCIVSGARAQTLYIIGVDSVGCPPDHRLALHPKPWPLEVYLPGPLCTFQVAAEAVQGTAWVKVQVWKQEWLEFKSGHHLF